MENKFDVIIIGGGPAGLTAGIYLSRAKIKTLIVNEGPAGGQMVLTHEIANYPGIEAISGYQLSKNMKTQAESFGCVVRANIKVTKIELSGDEKKVELNGKEIYKSKAVILATGGRSRMLGVSGEVRYKGKGISYCATCDGDFFQDKKIIVVGGGNSALEEAVSLTKYASKVTIVHQFNHFQAFDSAIREAKTNSKISFLMESEIIEFMGKNALEKVKIKNKATGEVFEKEISGVFIFIGYVPSTEMVKGIVKLNERNEIIADESMRTNVAGVFAAGDSREKRYRQITTSVSDGTLAALSAIEHLEKMKEPALV